MINEKRTWSKLFSKSSIEIIQLLIDAGADIRVNNDEFLVVARYFPFIKLAIENGADVNAYDGEAIIKASSLGDYKIVKYLIENNANYNSIVKALKHCNNNYINTLLTQTINEFQLCARIISNS